VMHDDDGADSAEPVGALLRRHRLAAAQDAGSLARDLCIRTSYVLAIENGHMQDLPGATYTLGFVRAYAEYFDLDEREIVARFKHEHYKAGNHRSLHFPTPEADAEIPRGALLLAGALTASVLYAAWHFNGAPGTDDVNLVDPVPEHLRSLLSTQAPEDQNTAPAENTPPTTTAGNGDHVPETPARREPSVLSQHPQGKPEDVRTNPVGSVVPTGTATHERQEQAGPETAPITTPKTTPKTNPKTTGETQRSGKVLLRATAECWVEISDSSGRVIYAKVMEPGDTYSVPSNAALTLLAGNAGGLEVYVDGRQMPPLGRAGAVLRHISLDAENLRARTRGG